MPNNSIEEKSIVTEENFVRSCYNLSNCCSTIQMMVNHNEIGRENYRDLVDLIEFLIDLADSNQSFTDRMVEYNKCQIIFDHLCEIYNAVQMCKKLQ